MLYVAENNLLPILLAVLIGFLTGWWIWRASREAEVRPERRDHLAEHQVPTQGTFARVSAPPVQPRHDPVPDTRSQRVVVSDPEVDESDRVVSGVDGPEGNDVISGAAAAAEDVAGQFLGVDAHPAQHATDEAEDDLQRLKGVGPKLAALLRAEGLTRYAQIAALGPEDLARLDLKLGAFKGRLHRDRVVEQAGFLARGDVSGYEAAFGRL